jgi:hypothetical protein
MHPIYLHMLNYVWDLNIFN